MTKNNKKFDDIQTDTFNSDPNDRAKDCYIKKIYISRKALDFGADDLLLGAVAGRPNVDK